MLKCWLCVCAALLCSAGRVCAWLSGVGVWGCACLAARPQPLETVNSWYPTWPSHRPPSPCTLPSYPRPLFAPSGSEGASGYTELLALESALGGLVAQRAVERAALLVRAGGGEY